MTTSSSKLNSNSIVLWTRTQAELLARRDPADRLSFTPTTPFPGLTLIGGVDISYPRNTTSTAIVALTVLSYPSLTQLYLQTHQIPITEPYISGFLAFRESPAYLAAFASLRTNNPELWPQVVLVDGNGTLHPRRFGSACHLGVELDIPTIGVAKNLLYMEGMTVDAKELKRMFKDDKALRGVGIEVNGDVCAMAVRPTTGEGATNPIFVSPGHRVSMQTAVELVRCCSRYRVPEPIRVADLHSRVVVRQLEELEASVSAE
ncbi:hypothetical protein LPJ66_002264 [Kickxella alabastrina]|uniref:Uncharacterized protein n=1 Tax=Kickxella alabastrina TaxID=61397 RepID=A0ACC1IQX1_9FUNG|nr:hypothetical protein LPJ66_002264 [Kickxella alabastrina]